MKPILSNAMYQLLTLCVPTNVFIMNKHGLPCLSKRHQAIVKKFMLLKNMEITLRTCENDSYRSASDFNGSEQYRAYINNLKQQVVKEDTNQESKPYSTISGYQDFLQVPLQPLHDHLDANTYEVFERDPYKYRMLL